MSTREQVKKVIERTEKALDNVGHNFKTILKYHLKNKYNSNLDLVIKDPSKFRKAISELFGEYTAKILENNIKETIIKGALPQEISSLDFKKFIQKIKKGVLEMAGY